MRGGGDFFGTRQSGHIISDIKNLHYPASVIFEAKKLADEALLCADAGDLRAIALQKYESLQNVVLN